MTGAIKIGQLRHRIKLQSAQKTPGDFALRADFSDVGVAWAMVQPLHVAEQGGDPITDASTHIFYVRARKDIDLTAVKYILFRERRHEVLETAEHGPKLEFMKLVTKRTPLHG